MIEIMIHDIEIVQSTMEMVDAVGGLEHVLQFV